MRVPLSLFDVPIVPIPTRFKRIELDNHDFVDGDYYAIFNEQKKSIQMNTNILQSGLLSKWFTKMIYKK